MPVSGEFLVCPGKLSTVLSDFNSVSFSLVSVCRYHGSHHQKASKKTCCCGKYLCLITGHCRTGRNRTGCSLGSICLTAVLNCARLYTAAGLGAAVGRIASTAGRCCTARHFYCRLNLISTGLGFRSTCTCIRAALGLTCIGVCTWLGLSGSRIGVCTRLGLAGSRIGVCTGLACTRTARDVRRTTALDLTAALAS